MKAAAAAKARAARRRGVGGGRAEAFLAWEGAFRTDGSEARVAGHRKLTVSLHTHTHPLAGGSANMAGAAPRPPLHSTWPHFNCRALARPHTPLHIASGRPERTSPTPFRLPLDPLAQWRASPGAHHGGSPCQTPPAPPIHARTTRRRGDVEAHGGERHKIRRVGVRAGVVVV